MLLEKQAMANCNPELIKALRATAARLQGGARYEWGHMGRCNCGHLVQTLTQMSDRQIVASIDHQLDEWTEHATDLCGQTNSKVEDLFRLLSEKGLERRDLIHLENLTDRDVLARLGGGHLRRNRREDAVAYMTAMAEMLEERCPS